MIAKSTPHPINAAPATRSPASNPTPSGPLAGNSQNARPRAIVDTLHSSNPALTSNARGIPPCYPSNVPAAQSYPPPPSSDVWPRLALHAESMPEMVRELAQPWPSLVGAIPGLTHRLEREFRFGQRVVLLDGTYRIGGTIKGGSSAMWIPSGPDLFRVYQQWAQAHGMPRRRRHLAYWRLRRLCQAHGIRIVNGAAGATRTFSPRLGAVYTFARAVLRALPAPHLDHPGFARLQIGGWGPDSAKASAYDQATVMLYDFAVKGARRTFLGLLLHEIGHVLESAESPADRADWKRWHAVIGGSRAFVATEFLASAKSRVLYQSHAWEEFAAETYMVYVAQGHRLREHVAAQTGEVRDAWEQVYGRLLAWFDGIQYK